MRLIQPGRAAESDVRIRLGAIVEYEQHGAPHLAMVTGERRGKWLVTNIAGAQLELPPDRLYLLPGEPRDAENAAKRAEIIKTLSDEASALRSMVNLGELWELVQGERREVSVRDLTELMLGENSAVNHLAMRRCLLDDAIYFKRKKTTYEPRPPEVVSELRVRAEIEAEKTRAREALVSAVATRLRDSSAELPSSIAILERYAALGKSFEDAKEASALIDDIVKRSGISIDARGEDRAFRLLVKAKHFSDDENLALIRLNRDVGFSRELEEEAERYSRDAAALAERAESRVDLRDVFTVTIDNESTRDIDDALSVERIVNGWRVGIYIADVAASVPQGSPLEQEALARATTVYTPDLTIPMFPAIFSEGAASLVEGQDRLVIASLLDVDEEMRVIERRIVPAVIRVKRRLTYELADQLLEQPNDDVRLCESLELLWRLSSSLEAERLQNGALSFNRKEMNARVLPDGRIVLEDNNEDTPAHRLVSELMIAANETAALFARSKGAPLIFRSQEPPDVVLAEQGLEIPEGVARDFYRRSFLKRSVTGTEPLAHFGLGLPAYAQSTSPIRRAADLVNQRQLLALAMTGRPLFDREKLGELMIHLERGLDEAVEIQRERNRYFLLKYLRQEGLKEIEATILRCDGPKPLAELDRTFSIVPFIPAGDPDPAIVRRRLGTRTRLRIENLDPRRDILTLREVEKH